MVLTRSQRGSSEDRKPQDEARAQPTIERTAQAPQSHASRPGGNALKRKLTAVQDEGLVNTVGNAVDATIQRGTASPSTSLHSLDDDDVADVTGYFGVLPREIIEQILGYLEPKELAMMDMTCRYFTESGVTDQVARHHLKNVTRAKVLSPMTDKGESSLMLLDFVQSQSAAAAQGTSIAMGTYHTLCLMSEEVQCCRGWELSLPTGPNREVEGTATAAATTAAASASTTCSSSADARTYGVYSFGRGFHGQLGTGLDHSDSSLPTRIEDVSKGEDLIGLDTPGGKDIRLAVVHAGSSHSMAISRRGELFTWGLSSSGELGHGTWSPTEVPVPKLVTSFGKTRIVSVCAGSNHTLAISEAGQLWSCGRNRYGQLGQGHVMDEASFFMVDAIRTHRIVSVAAGKFHSMALASDGKLFTWGDNSGGQLGQNNLVNHPTPALVEYLDPASLRPGARITAIAAGGYHSFALTVSGQLMATGRHKEGQLGVGTSCINGVKKFRRVNFSSGDAPVRVIQVQCGYLHSIALMQVNGKREVRSCGDNSFGQLGVDYSPTNGVGPGGVFIGHPRIDTFRKVHMEYHRRYPKSHGNAAVYRGYHSRSNSQARRERITCIASGDWHSGCITETGELLTWGRGDCGQLGHGNEISYWQPELMRWHGRFMDPFYEDDPGKSDVVFEELDEKPYRVVHPDRTLRRKKSVVKEAVVLTSPPPQPKRRGRERSATRTPLN